VDERSIEVFVFCPFKNGMVNVPKLPCIGGILLPHLTREEHYSTEYEPPRDNTTATSSLKQWRAWSKAYENRKKGQIYIIQTWKTIEYRRIE
jgi:hypothetical protein